MNTAALDQLRDLINRSENLVAFTGAGISTESGIPDFRSPGTGLWTKMQPIQYQEFISSEAIRTTSWSRRFDGERTMDSAKPNKGHQAIAQWIAEGRCTQIITQNVDNLHQDSGVPTGQIVELHGNATYAHCLTCKKRYELDLLEAQFREHGAVLPCSGCEGIIKSATISFGQQMPGEPMRLAQLATENCDTFLVVGSSLTVQPAASFPALAKQLGARLIIVNREETPLDDMADLLVRDSIGTALSYAAGSTGQPLEEPNTT